MKKIILAASLIIAVMANKSYAADSTLLGVRNKIYEESGEIKSLMSGTKDIILISSLWDACIMTVNQLDAYFSMMGIFNTIKKEDYTTEALDYLLFWLSGMQKTTEFNLQGLGSLKPAIDSGTKTRMVILKNYYTDLSAQLSLELGRLLKFKESLKPKVPLAPVKETRSPRTKK